MARNFTEAAFYMVRRLIREAYAMPANSVRPAGQPAPTGKEGEEFATVKIIAGPTADFGTSSIEWEDDPSDGSTKVIENIENVYRFTASVQFFRHAEPAPDAAGLSPFGMSAVDKAARLDAVLGSEAMIALMERMGLGYEGTSDPTDVGALIGGATWEDRGAVSLFLTIVNREQFLLESIAEAEITLQVQEPGKATLTTETIEVAQ